MGVTVIGARYGDFESDKIRDKNGKNIAKAQITIPLGIPDVRVLQTSVGEGGEIIITHPHGFEGHDLWTAFRSHSQPYRSGCRECSTAPVTDRAETTGQTTSADRL